MGLISMKSELQDLIDECTSEINDIETRIADMPALDKGVRYLTYYALMKASGITEFVYRSIVADYFSMLSDSRIDTYLDAAVRGGSMSAKYEMMQGLLGKFDDQWKKNFQNAVKVRPDKERLISASNSFSKQQTFFCAWKGSNSYI